MPKKSPARAAKKSGAGGSGYDFDGGEHEQEVVALAGKLKAAKGKDNIVKCLKQLRTALEGLPQDVQSLGGAQETLPGLLLQHATSANADKDVRMYGAICLVQLMRVFAPELPYDDDQLRSVYELLVDCWSRLAETGPGYDLARSMLAAYAEVKLYIPLLDLEDADLVGRAFARLLQAVRPDNVAALRDPVMSVLLGMVEESEQPPEEVVDILLAALVAGPAPSGGGAKAAAAQYSDAARGLAARLLAKAGDLLRGALQRRVMSHVRQGLQGLDAAGGAGAGPGQHGGRGTAASKAAAAGAAAAAAAGGDGGAAYDPFTLLHGLHGSAPQLLLPVIPELKGQLRQEDEHRRLAAAALVTRLLAAPPPSPLDGGGDGGAASSLAVTGASAGALASSAPMAAHYPDLVQELLQRYTDTSPAVRVAMLSRTPQLAAVAAVAAPDGGLERQVLGAARARLHDLEDKVRAAACRAICALATAAAAGPPASLLPPGGPAPPPLLDNDLLALLREEVAPRLRDRKIGVRREAAAGLLAAWRGACTSLQQGAMNMPGLVRTVGWVPARLCADLVRDLELRPHLMALLAAPAPAGGAGAGAGGGAKAAKGGVGLLPASLGQRVGSAVWAALWASYAAQDRAAVRKALALKARAALLLQELVELRGQIRAAARAEDEARVQKLKPRLVHVCAELSAAAGGPPEGQARGSEQLVRLVGEARDSFLFDRLAQLAAPTASAEAAAAARKDALSRLPGGGSKAPVADLITRLATAAAPTLLAPSHVAGLIAALDSGGGAAAAAGDGAGAAAKRDTVVVAAAAALAVAAAKSVPAIFVLAMPLVAGIVTAAPAKGELATVTAVRVLRHAARYCGGTPQPGPVAASGLAAAGARTQADGKGDDEEEDEEVDASDEDEEVEEDEEEEEEASPAKGKKRGRAAADSTKAGAARRKRRASGADGDGGKPSPSAAAGKRHMRGQQAAAADAAAGKAPAPAPGQGAGPVTAAAAEARSALLASLQELCLGPYRKVAKAAVHALSVLLLQPQSQPSQHAGAGGGGGGSGREHRAGVLRALAERLAAVLVPGCEAAPATAAAIEAMGSLGEVEPALFADYAAEYAAFIAHDCMAATLRDPARLAARQAAAAAAAAAAANGAGIGGVRRKSRPSSAQALAAGLAAEDDDDDEQDGEGEAEWGRPSYGVGMKAAALRALARGVTPDANARADAAAPLPAATVAAVMGPPPANDRGAGPSTSAFRAPAVAAGAGGGGAVEELLVRLLNVEEEDLEEFGARHDVDRAHLRYTAARCMLHLARRYDSRLGGAAYTALALAMQDPFMEVRRDVGDKVRMFLHTALQLGLRPSTRSRYAAMLPLAVMDPVQEHAEAAARTLREVVLLTRSRMAAAALAAATGAAAPAGASSRPSLGDAPEFLLAHLVYVLAHHPDVAVPPERYAPAAASGPAGRRLRKDAEADEEDTQDIPDPDAYRPFQDMLQLALEALLVPRGPGQQGGGGGASGAAAAAKPLSPLAADAGEALPAVCKILRSVKITMYDADESVDAAASTRTVRLMADVGLAVAKAIVTRELTAAAGAAGGGGAKGGRARSKPVDAGAIAAQVEALSWREHPGQVVVPRALYRLARPEEQPKGLNKDGSCLPPAYEVLLSPTIAGLGLRAPAAGSGGAAGVASAGNGGRGEDGALLPARQQASAGRSSGGDRSGSAGSGGFRNGGVTLQQPEADADAEDDTEAQAAGRRTAAAVTLGKPRNSPQTGRVRGAKRGAAAPARAGGKQQRKTPPRKKPRGGYESLSELEEEEEDEESDEEEEEEQAAPAAKPRKRAVPVDAYGLPEEEDEEEEEAAPQPQPAAGKGGRGRGMGASKSPPAQATAPAAAAAVGAGAKGGAHQPVPHDQPQANGAGRKDVRGARPAAAAAAAAATAAAMDTSPSSPDENDSEGLAHPDKARGSGRVNGFGYADAADASRKQQQPAAKSQRQPLKQQQQAAQQQADVAAKQRSKPSAAAGAAQGRAGRK
ncbi:hypothetical protein HXX76_001510 [Chlamydomonas incerta]|uniref:Sister chromatid cohesion protein n=1 Tax=Chlamydomonas incerta TaxID=51695 RepID=A0A835WCE3_CHLIN|nr:hypothetical protein HXX76_001510 [Chlamydomonas incerta]|eukprot:KAG2444766.1 hypothetical protein HXX76_001510 [Chlamydomonas incerta]